MRKTIIIISTLFIIIGANILHFTHAPEEPTITRAAKVYSRDANGTVFLADGHLWSVTDDITWGHYTLVFDSCGTPCIEDDIILEIIPD